MLTLFERGLIAHLIADWIFQNDWMARHKGSLRHPASWVHAGIHILLLSLALGWAGGLVLGLFHMLIDTRQPLRFWRSFFKQTEDGPAGFLTAVWADQVLHIALIAFWVSLIN